MPNQSPYQIVISGIGGQGVLFITRLLAEAAIEKGLPVFTSETHGMAQRGGTVISHLKIGNFSSPLIVPGSADGLIALKAESLVQHGGYLKPGGWAAVNSPAPVNEVNQWHPRYLDADRLAADMDNPRALNLIMLGFTLGNPWQINTAAGPLHCSLTDMAAVLEKRLQGKGPLLQASIQALMAGGHRSSPA
ncbi:MAG: 2-oxoacid:acceptor oxidoreductase family protein [Desulfosarcina sp.]|jgi:indolepyruvate ferredoxin oxidoreductase beta subunit